MKRTATLLLAAFTAWILSIAPLSAAESGDVVVVVYNKDFSGSKEVAQYYAEKRHVPDRQVIGLDLPKGEDMSRKEFEKKLQKPLAEKLEKLKLIEFGPVGSTKDLQPERKLIATTAATIRYLVLCHGVPLRIKADDSLSEPGALDLQPELRRNEAAVDSELAWLPKIKSSPMLAGPMSNPLYGATNAARFSPTNGILLVSRLDGPTPDIAKGLVDKALAAEKNGLWGHAYFDVRNTTDPAFKQGDQWINNAADICRQLGFEVTVDEKPGVFWTDFPMSQIAIYAGWYAEHASGPFARPTVEFMPGAFAYHLHSWSGCTLRSDTKHWVGPFLAKGVTATMGSVWEPYLAGTPDVGTFCARFIYFGFSFGEAAYACQNSLSWQTTVVGDPLYRPFGESAQRLHERLDRENNPLAAWSYLRVANLNLARGTKPADVAAYLTQLKLTASSAVLSEKLGDVYKQLGKPDSASHAYEDALKLDASPMQKARLRLELGEQFFKEGKDQKAWQYYNDLLTGWPDYPDANNIRRKLLIVARKLGKDEEAKKIEDELKRLTPSGTGP